MHGRKPRPGDVPGADASATAMLGGRVPDGVGEQGTSWKEVVGVSDWTRGNCYGKGESMF